MAQSLSYRIQTDNAVNWTGALAQNAQANESIVVPWADAHLELILTAITVVSDQNLAWELDFWRNGNFGTSNPNTDGFIGNWQFQAVDGFQIAGTGSYRYFISGLWIPLWDETGAQTLFTSLVNRSAASKNAGATGRITVTFHVEAQQVGGA